MSIRSVRSKHYTSNGVARRACPKPAGATWQSLGPTLTTAAIAFGLALLVGACDEGLPGPIVGLPADICVRIPAESLNESGTARVFIDMRTIAVVSGARPSGHDSFEVDSIEVSPPNLVDSYVPFFPTWATLFFDLSRGIESIYEISIDWTHTAFEGDTHGTTHFRLHIFEGEYADDQTCEELGVDLP